MVGELLRDTSIKGSEGFLSFLDGFVDGVAVDLGLDEELTSNIVISVSEALNNAFVHGNKRDEGLSIALAVYHSSDALTFVVRDQGGGYDYELLNDDLSDDLLDVPGGRGLFIMRALADEVSNNEEGNEVYLTFLLNGH
jgi:serine/threonine-protein kinase RsbW